MSHTLSPPAPWQLALASQAEVVAFTNRPIWGRYVASWLGDREERHGFAAANPSMHALLAVPDDLLAAEPLYVTAEMQALVFDAMDTFNGREPMIAEELLYPCGFAVLDEPFRAADSNGKIGAWRAIQWRILTAPVRYATEDDLSSRSIGDGAAEKLGDPGVEERQVLRFVLWSHVDDVDDYWSDITAEHARAHGLTWTPLHAVTFPLEYVHEIATNERAEADENGWSPPPSWTTFFRVMHRLMAERIVARSSRQAARPVRRDALRHNLTPRDVVVVELRRPKDTSPEAPGTDRRYTHRWVVRGHWRNQWYPSLDAHRQKYIGAYVKGPDDAELVIKTRVWAWDR